MKLFVIKPLMKADHRYSMRVFFPVLVIGIALSATIVSPVMGQPKRASNNLSKLWSDNSADTSLPRVLVIDNGLVEQYYDSLKVSLTKAGLSYTIMRFRTTRCVGDSGLLSEMEYLLNDNQYAVIQFTNGLQGMDYTELEYTAAYPGYLSTMVNNSHGAKLIWTSCTYGGSALDARIKARNQIAKQNVTQNSSIIINDLYDSTSSHSAYFNANGNLTGSGIPAVASICASAIKKALTLYNQNKPPKYIRYSGATVFREGAEWADCGVVDTGSLPRVLMCGNSITRGYHDHVNANLAGKAVCSYLASSKCFGDPAALKEYSIALNGMNYAVIHFNNGLHGISSYSLAQYDTGFVRTVALIKKLAPKAQLIFATCTPMYSDANAESIEQKRMVDAVKYCQQFGITINDLHTLANNHPETRAGDGAHYTDAGYVILGKQVSDSITQALARYRTSINVKRSERGTASLNKRVQGGMSIFDMRGRKMAVVPHSARTGATKARSARGVYLQGSNL
jgi:hypothetical protein